MPRISAPPPSDIFDFLDYDPITGEFWWKKRLNANSSLGVPIRNPDKDGYLRVGFRGHKYRLHRLAWLYVTGEWPKELIDHRDCNPANNAFSNLREADKKQNGANQLKRHGTSSNYKGVTWNAQVKKWQSTIKTNGRCVYLGCFEQEEEAAKAYAVAAEKLHGEFLNLGVRA